MGKAEKEIKSRGPCPVCSRKEWVNASQWKEHLAICRQLERLGLERG